jgi:choline-sulfatase
MRWTTIFGSVIFALVLFGAAVTFQERFAKRPVNVILLTVESLRADRFSTALAPKFFAAARQATAFEKHRAIASWTGPNIIALLTGLSPFVQGVHSRGQSVREDWDIALQRLAGAGWKIGSVQAFAKSENFDNLGMHVVSGETVPGWIARRRLAKEPFFFWHHYLGTHLPYNPAGAFLSPAFTMPESNDAALERMKAIRSLPAIRAGSVKFEPADKLYITELYDGGIREFDAWFDGFWRFLVSSGLREDTLLIVTADHGEELLDRGNVGHASTTRAGTLFEEVVRIPLFVWWPKRFESVAKAESERASDHLDIMPTVFDVLNIAAASPFSGTSLRNPPRENRWYAITSRAGFSEEYPDNIRRFVASVAEGRWKLIAETDRRNLVSVHLHDLDTDPGERNDIALSRPEIVGRLLPPLSEKIENFVLPKERKSVARTADGPAGVKSSATPQWLFPAESGTISWDALQGRAYLEWTGEPSDSYVLEYKAGSGALAVSGRIIVSGTKKDFGVFSRKYWDTWVVPYEEVKLRVRPESGSAWSSPLTLSLTE